MHIAVIILFFLAFLASFGLQGRYFIHIFQLRLHHNKTDNAKWIMQKSAQILPKQILSLVTIPLIVFFGDSGIILSGIIYIILGYMYKPRELREQMQYTKRTVRVIFPVALIGLIVTITAICLCQIPAAMALITSLYFIFIPYLIVAADRIFNNDRK